MIYTSYFSKYKGSNGVSIARGASWYKGNKYPDLCPSAELLAWWKYKTSGLKEIPQELKDTYSITYLRETLNNLDVDKVYKELDGKVLLCFEKSNDFCHRHLVSEWFKINGYECEELK